jgi:hypothetical protein
MWCLLFKTGSLRPARLRIRSERALVRAVAQMIARQGAATLFFEKEGPSLSCFVVDGLASASYDPNSSEQPYRVLRSRQDADGELVIFNVGNTATEIQRYRCVPVDDLGAVALHFYKTKQLLESDRWTWEVDAG